MGTVEFNKTGSWRQVRPTYEEKLPPCNNACPVGTDIRGFAGLLAKGRLLETWKLIKKNNPLPGICGRVCPHPCEQSCNRTELDEAVSIHNLERLTADYALNEGISERLVPVTREERIAVVGSGPAGLSCAYFLAKDGYSVTVFEDLPVIGGMLRVGIPAYRLPRQILDKEIADIEALGVTFQTNTRTDDVKQLKDYSAVFVAVGAHKSRKLNVPGEDASGVITGVEFLKSLNLDGQLRAGQSIVVIGGGNTAIDAARSALRTGAKSTVVYRRTREEMPAIAEEVEEACKEGVGILYLAAPVSIKAQAKGEIEVEFLRMKPGDPDETGRKNPVPIEGSQFVMRADAVIAAVGEQPNLCLLPEGLLLSESGVEHDGMRIFGGGDASTGRAGTVAGAIVSGRRAARSINSWLRGNEIKNEPARKSVSFGDLNAAYFVHEAAVRSPKLAPTKRIKDFSEINLGISAKGGIKEAKRCFSCGDCTHCDNCVTFCPDICISKRNEHYEIDYDYCKGCGICYEECPCSHISLVAEER